MLRPFLLVVGALCLALPRGGSAQALSIASVRQAAEPTPPSETAAIEVTVQNDGAERQPGFAVQIVVQGVVRGSYRGGRPIVAPGRPQTVSVAVDRARIRFGDQASLDAEVILRGPDGRGPELDRQAFQLRSATAPPPSSGIAPMILTTVPMVFDAFEAMPVWRIQLRVTTCDVEGAETFGPASVTFAPAGLSLGSGNVRVAGPGQRSRGAATATARPSDPFWLDLPGADRQRGATDTYELVLEGIQRVSDIQHIEIASSTEDDWCIKHVALGLNARADGTPETVFETDFGRGVWIRSARASNRTVMVATSEDLRASPTWNLDGPRAALTGAPEVISVATLSRIIGGILGNALGRRGELEAYDWARDARVPFWTDDDPRPNAAVIRTDLVTVEERAILRDRRRSVELSMTLVATCEGGRLRLDVENVVLERARNWGALFNPLVHLGASIRLGLNPRNVGNPEAAGREIDHATQGGSSTASAPRTSGGAPCEGDVRFTRLSPDQRLRLFPPSR